MTAREELYAFGMSGKHHSPDNSERMSARIDAYRAEVLREYAIRLASRATLYGDSRTVNEIIRELDRFAEFAAP